MIFFEILSSKNKSGYSKTEEISEKNDQKTGKFMV